MQEMDLLKLDFKLLIALRALLEERSVTRAGERVGLSQSAMSHALSRLRQVFHDPLLVRSGQEMLTTSRAAALLEPLQNILLEIEHLIQPLAFDPRTAQGTIHIGTSDYTTCVILPSVVKRIEQEAPCLNLVCQHWASDSFDSLKDGTLDLGFGALNILSDRQFQFQELFTEDFVCLVRADHPVLETGLTLESFVAYPHALVSIPQTSKSYIDAALENLGMQRRIMLKVAHFFAAPLIVAQSNLISIMPRRVAKLFTQWIDLAMLESPIKIQNYTYVQIWHPRHQYDLQHIWLRKLIADETQKLETYK